MYKIQINIIHNIHAEINVTNMYSVFKKAQ